MLPIFNIVLQELVVFWLASDFVTNTCSYGESWDSSCEKSWVPVHNQGVLSWKCLGLYVNQTVTLETDAKTLYYSLLKLKYSPSISLKHKKDKNKNASFNNSHRNFTNRVFYQKIFKSIDRSLCPAGRISWIILCLWGFLCVWDAGSRGNKIIVGLKNFPLFL